MYAKLSRCAGLAALFLVLAAAYRPPAWAILSSGVYQVISLLTTSGGSIASNGDTSMFAVNIGGLTDSGVAMSGGDMVLSAGETPAVITYNTARSDLSAAHCYPVPFKPSAGHTKITFTALTESVKIRIYTVSGEMVRTLGKADMGETLDWDVRNTQGYAVDSGVYIYIIEGSVARPKKGKLMIIR
ncbi:MAG: hypothetical protein NDI60_07080 [Elusimicrobiales bacterium]|nr:hypothetical protein [Elusimicrobiales bacterium]